MPVTVAMWKLEAAVNLFLADCMVCCGGTDEEDADGSQMCMCVCVCFGHLFGNHLSPLVWTEIKPRRIPTRPLPQVR